MEENKEEQKNKKISFKDIKEFLSDKKNKAIVKLIIYFIFFAIVIIYIRIINFKNNSYPVIDNTQQVEQLPKNITDKVYLLKDASNYAFKYDISAVDNNEEINYSIEGKRYNNKYYFVINKNNIIEEFYYDNDKLYRINDETTIEESIENIIDLSLYRPSNIYNYLYNATYNYKQENAIGDIIINSSLLLSKFYELNEIGVESEEILVIETIENNNNDDLKIIINTSNINIDNINTIDIYINNIDSIEEFQY